MKGTTLTIALGVLTIGISASASAADIDAGKKVYNKCKACHTLEEGGKNKVGPNLFGIIGRPSASVDGFKYSDALKSSGITWTEDKLAEFLAKPKAVVPKTKMAFPGLKKEEEIENIIAYIKGS